MESFKLLQPREVKALSTKFYYKNDSLCFQITLQYGEGNLHLYKEYEDYDAYRSGHDQLVKAMNADTLIQNDFLAA